MASKVKMRCARCGKPFKSSNAKQTLCDACEAKARAERAASKAQAAKPVTGNASTPAPKIVGPGAAILGVPPTVAATPMSPEHDHARAERREPHEQRHDARDQRLTPAAPMRGQPQGQGHGPSEAHAPRAPMPAKEPKPAPPPKQPKQLKQPKPTAPAIELTDELRAHIEQRYIELAQPVEFDGIRTQIAAELSVPKHLVKRAVLDLRQRQQTPSWWELQAFAGGAADLERIRQAYVPHLPVPPVGIHKQIAVDLHLEPIAVYRAIRRIRAELHLPQFNPPDLHTEEEAAVVAAPEPSEASPADAR